MVCECCAEVEGSTSLEVDDLLARVDTVPGVFRFLISVSDSAGGMRSKPPVPELHLLVETCGSSVPWDSGIVYTVGLRLPERQSL